MALKRTTPLRRSDPDKIREWQRRSKPISPVNRKRRAKRRARDFGEHADTIRGLPCDLCGAPPPSDPHHARTRGAGGTAKHLVPLCRACHTLIHDGHGPSREHLLERAAYYWTTS